MSVFKINTKSGGLIELDSHNSQRNGRKLYLHIDQSTNINNGEGDASILLTNDECREMISMLNSYIEFDEGVPFVVLAAPLLDPSVKIIVNDDPSKTV